MAEGKISEADLIAITISDTLKTYWQNHILYMVAVNHKQAFEVAKSVFKCEINSNVRVIWLDDPVIGYENILIHVLSAEAMIHLSDKTRQRLRQLDAAGRIKLCWWDEDDLATTTRKARLLRLERVYSLITGKPYDVMRQALAKED